MEDLDKTDLVMVYGTLMKGERNHHLLEGAELINDIVETAPAGYLMLQFESSSSPGKYSPGIRRGHHEIIGELYRVNAEQLEALDELEQNGVRYQRETVVLTNGDTAWLYVMKVDDEPAEDQSLIITSQSGVQKWARRMSL